MLIDLQEIMLEDNYSIKLKPQLDSKFFKTNKVSYEIKEYDLNIFFHNEGDRHIHCKCQGFVVLNIPCDRCLDNVDYHIDISYNKDLDMNKTEEQRIAELDEEAYIVDSSFDFDRLIYNEILIHLPMKVLCREDCKGICNRCGANLNMGSCHCDNAELDPRMSKILDVFNQFKEV